MEIRDRYQKEIAKKLRYFANWLPNNPIRIGDVGTLTKMNFETDFNLLSRYPDVAKPRRSKHPSDIQFYSEGSATITFIGDAVLPSTEKLLESKNGIKIKFKKPNSVFFEGKGAVIQRLEHLDILKEKIIELRQSGRWEEDLVIVTDIVEIDYSTIIITNEKDAEVILRSENDIELADTQLASVSGSFKIEDKSSTEVCLVGEKKLTPLFKVRRLKKKLFKKTEKLSPLLHSRIEQEYELDYLEASQL